MSNYAKSLDKLKSSAQGAATVRAFAHKEEDPNIRNPDNLARSFLDKPPSGTDTLNTFKQQLGAILPGAYHFQNARTLHIDSRINQAIEDGYKQIVLLGAGLDTRAYRLAKSQQVQFIEIDLPALQEEKKQKVIKLLGALPSNVTYIPLDFNTQSLEDALSTSAYNESLPTFFNWEGVCYYLTAEGVDATLKTVAKKSPAKSRILFDYMPQSMIDGTVEYYGGKESRSYMSEFGEPVIFGIPDNSIGEFLGQRGFSINTDLSPEQLAQDYLRRSDGAIDGRVAGYIRMVEAEVN